MLHNLLTRWHLVEIIVSPNCGIGGDPFSSTKLNLLARASPKRVNLLRCLVGRLVGWLEFNVPFQHKYGYIREERSGVESYPLTQ